MLDKILTHKLWGMLILAALMSLVFYETFSGAGRLLRIGLDHVLDVLTDRLSRLLILAGCSGGIHSLVMDGICTGITSVLSFLPSIAVLFFFLALLDKSGYMSRVAVLMDGMLSRFGLCGQAMIPFIMGFGCSVPAVMSAGSLLTGRQKYMAIFLTPFMSCSAKLPIYMLMAGTFFPQHQGLAVAAIYMTGIIIALLSCLIFEKSYGEYIDQFQPLRHHDLPAIKLPSLSSVLSSVMQSCGGFLKKTFTVIFAASVAVWFLQNFDTEFRFADNVNESLLAVLGMLAAPLLEPLGFGSWQSASAIIAGLAAKESVVSTLAIMAGPGGDIFPMLHGIFDPLTAYSFMVFSLLYVPCTATLSAVKKETGSWRFPAFMVLIQLLTAWCVSFLIFNVGRLII